MEAELIKLKERYSKEPWGKLLLEMGRDPYETGSSARGVAAYCVERIEKLEKDVKMFDYLASLWDSQGTSAVKIMGHDFENPTGSFRDAVAAKMSEPR